MSRPAWAAALALLLAACAGPTEPEPTGMQDIRALQARVAPLTSLVGKPGACALPNHSSSNECWQALMAIGAIAPVWYQRCRKLDWAGCVSSSFALAAAIQHWDQAIDQHGHRSPFDHWWDDQRAKEDNGFIP